MTDTDYRVYAAALNTFYIYENPNSRSDKERLSEMREITNVEDPLTLPEWTVFEEPEYEGEPQCRVDTATRINIAVPEDVDPFEILDDYLSFDGDYDPAMGAFDEGRVSEFDGDIHLHYDDI